MLRPRRSPCMSALRSVIDTLIHCVPQVVNIPSMSTTCSVVNTPWIHHILLSLRLIQYLPDVISLTNVLISHIGSSTFHFPCMVSTMLSFHVCHIHILSRLCSSTMATHIYNIAFPSCHTSHMYTYIDYVYYIYMDSVPSTNTWIGGRFMTMTTFERKGRTYCKTAVHSNQLSNK